MEVVVDEHDNETKEMKHDNNAITSTTISNNGSHNVHDAANGSAHHNDAADHNGSDGRMLDLSASSPSERDAVNDRHTAAEDITTHDRVPQVTLSSIDALATDSCYHLFYRVIIGSSPIHVATG